MRERIRTYGRLAARALGVQSQREGAKLGARALALLLVAAAAAVKYVTGLTVQDAPFTLYAFAVAASAALWGFAPGMVAMLASVLVARLGTPPAGSAQAHLLFAAEGASIALVVSLVRSRLHATQAQLGASIAESRLRDRDRRVLDAALRHLEETVGEAAVIVLDDGGAITGWGAGAERLYGYGSREILGTSAAALFPDAPSKEQWSALLRESVETGSVRRSEIHRRQDGTRLHVDLDIRPTYEVGRRGFTLTVQDLARRREWDDYRQAARLTEGALQQAADEARRQLAALENLTDPSLTLLEGRAIIVELLERLRVTVRADGVALVQPGRVAPRVVAASGLQPIAGPRIKAGSLRLTPGRVAIVHNDPARVEQLSAVRWSPDVTSLMAVPVVQNGQVRSTIEIVSERPHCASDWDVALVRIVADRLAAVIAQDRGLAATGS